MTKIFEYFPHPVFQYKLKDYQKQNEELSNGELVDKLEAKFIEIIIERKSSNETINK